MHSIVKIVPLVMGASLMLSGCGTSTGDRGLSGGLLGAGTGATIGALAGSAGTGALWGGLGGAAIGMLTSPEVINLGKPIWKQSASSGRPHKYAAKSPRKSSARVARTDERCSTRETATQRITTCAKAN
jgi:osmotically inducible lipoprotein OsmB